jgi:hypothetical protein
MLTEQTPQKVPPRTGQAARTEAGAVRGAALRAQGFPKPVRGHFGVMLGVLLVQLVCHLLQLGLEVAAAFGPGIGAGVRAALPAFAPAYELAAFIFLVAAPIGCVTWFSWLDRDVKNLYADGIHDFGRTPLEIVMAYMVPGVNLYRPLADLQRLRAGLAEGQGWRRAPGERLLTVFWLASLLQLGLMGAELLVGPSALTLVSSLSSVLVQLLTLALLRRFALAHPYWQAPLRALPPVE